jgi:uncharacterized protein YycO
VTTPVLPLEGDFFVTSIRGPVGFAISLGEWLNGSAFSHWDHAGVYVGDGRVVEAEPDGARVADLSEYDGRPIAWSTGRVQWTDEVTQRQAIVSAAEGYAAARVGYSAADYFAIAAHRLHVPGSRLLKSYVGSSKRLICSQLVDRCYLDAGVHLFSDGRWPGYVTPADLAKLIGV